MVNAIVAVCVSEPDVAVTVTVAVVGGGGFVPPLFPLLPPHADSMTRPDDRSNSGIQRAIVRRFLQNRSDPAKTSVAPGRNGFRPGRAFDADALAEMVSCVVAALPEGVTVDGLNEQVAPAGRPEQAN